MSKLTETKEWRREYMKKWRFLHPEKERKYQKESNKKRKEYHAKWYQEHKEEYRPIRQKYYIERKDYFKRKAREWYDRNKERKAKQWKKKRLKVINHYGGECVCCKEGQIEFLALDHVNNDGKQHRAGIKINIYDWAIKNNFPKNLQVLCHNCNLAKAFYGYCPHEND